MKLPGYLDERFAPPAPSIYAQIETRVLEGRQSLAFLIDTGASATTILDPDLERLGIDWNSLVDFEGQQAALCTFSRVSSRAGSTA